MLDIDWVHLYSTEMKIVFTQGFVEAQFCPIKSFSSWARVQWAGHCLACS